MLFLSYRMIMYNKLDNTLKEIVIIIIRNEYLIRVKSI